MKEHFLANLNPRGGGNPGAANNCNCHQQLSINQMIQTRRHVSSVNMDWQKPRFGLKLGHGMVWLETQRTDLNGEMSFITPRNSFT
jgi:hypothetical protein